MTKTYTEEFKQDAVRLVETNGKPKTQVARDLEGPQSVCPRLEGHLPGSNPGCT
ncbi:MAG: transposase [Anaerolineae bacterium]|nr:transposase [Anaerolineae bacterium]